MCTKLFVGVFCAVLLFLIQPSLFDNYAGITVVTKLGVIKGSLMKTRLGKDIFAFRGVPYIEQPVGILRFKEPIPKYSWDGILDATSEAPACPQTTGIYLSENCVVMNVYSKKLPNIFGIAGELLPVIVYIHTGAFDHSSAQSFVTGPGYLLDHDIVLVTINYRLGTLGFINTGDKYASGNLGLKDQVEALRFIRDHISSFGGDPNSVTLTGQSAGARSVILHMVSPMSKGLFHRAIALSGSPITPIPPQREQIGLAKKQAKLLNCTTKDIVKMFECLKKRSPEDFGKTLNSMEEWNGLPVMVWYPADEVKVPGVEIFLPDNPETLIKQGKVHPVPLIIGVTMNETEGANEALQGNFTYYNQLNNDWYNLAPICFGYNKSKSVSDKISKFYFNNKPIGLNNSASLRLLFANAINQFPTYKAANLIARYSPAPVYFYEFTYQGQYISKLHKEIGLPNAGVAHKEDLQYIFTITNDVYSKIKSYPIYNDDDPEILMVKRLTKLWTNFAKTSKPLPKDFELFGNVEWERFTPESKRYLDIGDFLVMKSNYMSREMNFWEKIFP